MTVRSAAVFLSLLILLVAAAFWARSERDRATVDVPPAVAHAPAAPTPAPPDALPPPETIILPDTLPPMPPDDASIADALPSLQARADAGDSKAACRLGLELLRCSYLTRSALEYGEQMAQEERRLQARGKLDEADEIAASLLASADLQRRCAGVDEAQVARAGHYVRQAALAGETEALLRYAQGETLEVGNYTYRFVRSPAFDTWRREAPLLLERAMRAGQPAAVLAVAQAHRGDSWLAMLLPRDPLEAETNLALARRLFGEDPALARLQPDNGVDDDDRVRAQHLAAERHARDFGEARWNLVDTAAMLAPLHALHESAWPAPGRADRVPCASPPAGIAP